MNDRILEEAAVWHIAQQRDDADWTGFALWLEADPLHRSTYNDVVLLDDDINRHRAALADLLPVYSPMAANDDPVAARWWRLGGIGMAAAAAIALVVGLPLLNSGSEPVADYRTGPRQSSMIALVDGSRITLGASSHLRVSGKDQQQLVLEGGGYFDIPHDPARVMTISAGGYQISDIGTQFDLATSGRVLKVAVAQGTVSVGSGGLQKAVPLTAGRQLLLDGDNGLAELSPVAVQDIGSWKSGRLVYNNAPLSLVAADVSRYAGKPVKTAQNIADRRFSGVLTIGNGTGLVGDLQQFMGLQAIVATDGIRLEDRGTR